ncbi:MAG: hypothetical protein EXR67_06230 [Dehalococcoidia bacterium]|nr:hypothetical protein [Dehalococcoidia bacterium]
MPIDPAILADNAAQLRRLQALATQLTDGRRDMGGGWTVTVALAHMAFWDRRATLLLQRWNKQGTLPDKMEDDLLNSSLLEEWQALNLLQAANLALSAAHTVNVAVEALSPETADSIKARGDDWLLRRSNHRREHLDQIERTPRA